MYNTLFNFLIFLTEGEREAIWSVPKWALRTYYIFFVLLMGLGVFDVWCIVCSNETESTQTIEFYQGIAAVAIASAGLALFLVELSIIIINLFLLIMIGIGGAYMVLGTWMFEVIRSQQQKAFERKVDKIYGEGTAEQLKQKQEQDQQQTKT